MAGLHSTAYVIKYAGLATVCLFLLASAAIAEKTDVVVLQSGDRITGEIRRLERAVLRFKTDHMGTLQIEWPEVATITGEAEHEVELSSGERYFGPLLEPDEPGQLRIRTETGDQVVDHDDVIRIHPIEARRLARFDGSLDVGFSYAKANDTTSLSLNAQFGTRTRKWERSLVGSSTLTAQEDRDDVERSVGTYTLTRFLGRKWQASLLARVESNEELGLRLRSTVAAGAGRFVVQTNTSELLWIAGLSVNREEYRDVPESEDNYEGLLGLTYLLFLFGDRQTDLRVQTIAWPSFTVSKRVRIETDLRFRRELIKDFYVGVTVYHAIDTEPPTINGVENDWGLSTSIGYSF